MIIRISKENQHFQRPPSFSRGKAADGPGNELFLLERSDLDIHLLDADSRGKGNICAVTVKCYDRTGTEFHVLHTVSELERSGLVVCDASDLRLRDALGPE